MHDNKSNSGCETTCEPLQSWKLIVLEVKLEDGGDNDANQPAEEVAENERARLSKWDINRSVAKNCRSALRGHCQ